MNDKELKQVEHIIEDCIDELVELGLNLNEISSAIGNYLIDKFDIEEFTEEWENE
jgi:hypothetical protein